MVELALGSSIRSSLLTLQELNALSSVTENRLATGLKVSSALDDAAAFFQARALTDRAADFLNRKDDIDEAVSSLQAANDGVEAVDATLRQLKGLLQSAKTASTTELSALQTQFNSLSEQLNEIVSDTTYAGLNLLNSSTASLTVNFSDSSSAQLSVNGTNILVSSTQSGALFTAGVAAGSLASTIIGFAGGTITFSNAAVSNFDLGIERLDAAISNLRSVATNLGSNVTFLNTRLDFTEQYTTTLQEGADKLTLADINEEGAKLVALQTRQELAIQALAFAGQSERAVLTLFDSLAA
ncbi:flagellin [Marinibaculum pumilum]|uniref:Flagellin n=1 Tax=Marinibaculum pumilum TaxID=1766165 RepID=A0ABV7KUS5_9PROT